MIITEEMMMKYQKPAQCMKTHRITSIEMQFTNDQLSSCQGMFINVDTN